MGTTYNNDNAHLFIWHSVAAIRTVGGHSCVHRLSRPIHMGWTLPEWTDAKYLHRGATVEAAKHI